VKSIQPWIPSREHILDVHDPTEQFTAEAVRDRDRVTSSAVYMDGLDMGPQ